MWVEFSKITKNCLKVGKNDLKVRFDMVWWVLYSVLLFEGVHDLDCRELNQVLDHKVSSVRIVGHDIKRRAVFHGWSLVLLLPYDLSRHKVS